MPGWSFAAVWDGVAAIVPERDALVCGDRRVTWAAFSDRATRLARHLEQSAALQPGDKVAIDLTNRPEYLETFYAALKIGCTPVNVNFRYQADEVHYLLENSDARVLVHGEEFDDIARTAASRIAAEARPYLLSTGADYETALQTTVVPGGYPAREPDGDDLVFLYTGGTTGMPKGVMWRSDDIYRAIWASTHPRSPEPPDPWAAARAGKRSATLLTAAPLMHGTGLFAAVSTLAGSGTVVLIDRPGLDVVDVWDTVEREGVGNLTIVGDVFARPLLDALDAEPERWDLSGLRAIASSGVLFSADVKQGLLAHLPHTTIVDSVGASEGLGPRSTSGKADGLSTSGRYSVSDRVRVIDPDTGLDVEPGSGEAGLLAMGGNIPLGYYKDQAKSDETFRTFAGRRFSIPGDYATVDADGTVQLLGRGSSCINTGGEKVYPHEVEAELLQHDRVRDCVVVGAPDSRFGEKVVAIVELADADGLDDVDVEELTAWCRARMAAYKTPRRFITVDSIGRSASGKADLPRLQALAADAVAA